LAEIGNCGIKGFLHQSDDPRGVEFSYPSQLQALNASHGLLADSGNRAIWLIKWESDYLPATTTLLKTLTHDIVGIYSNGESIFSSTPAAILKGDWFLFGNFSNPEFLSLHHIQEIRKNIVAVSDTREWRIIVFDLTDNSYISIMLPRVHNADADQPTAMYTAGQTWYISNVKLGLISAMPVAPRHMLRSEFRITYSDIPTCHIGSVYHEIHQTTLEICSYYCVVHGVCHAFSFRAGECHLHSWFVNFTLSATVVAHDGYLCYVLYEERQTTVAYDPEKSWSQNQQ